MVTRHVERSILLVQERTRARGERHTRQVAKGGFTPSLAIVAQISETNHFYKRQHTQSFNIHACFFIKGEKMMAFFPKKR